MSVHYINPIGLMDQLTQLEVESLKQSSTSDLYQLYRNCSLAVLNSGAETDNSHTLLDQFSDFEINIVSRERGVKLELINPPEHAFVDHRLILNIQHHLFSVLRDILFIHVQNFMECRTYDLTNSEHITNYLFSLLRNAGALTMGETPNLVVCWGGHAISKTEYDYCHSVGLELGLRELNIVTGCGTGAMEAPMMGATLGHAKQRYTKSRFIGITEPSIIASEPPNPIVNELIIMPDIEKRLEAFIRLGHGIIIFPGGPGTAEELLYILGVLLNEENARNRIPVILTAPKESADYFKAFDEFIANTLGEKAQELYEIIIDNPAEVARKMRQSMETIKHYRSKISDSFSFNWTLKINSNFQKPFVPTHENMRNLNLHLDQNPEDLAAALRCAFSGIVSGNIKTFSIEQIKQKGPYELYGDPKLMRHIDVLCQSFINQHRMKLSTDEYVPCYKIVE